MYNRNMSDLLAFLLAIVGIAVSIVLISLMIYLYLYITTPKEEGTLTKEYLKTIAHASMIEGILLVILFTLVSLFIR